jgi:hypothetical protein
MRFERTNCDLTAGNDSGEQATRFTKSISEISAMKVCAVCKAEKKLYVLRQIDLNLTWHFAVPSR